MAGHEIHLTLVSLEYPCSACIIITNLLREMLAELGGADSGLSVEQVVLKHIREAALVPGLEVERFPAMLVNGEQITAGSLPPMDELIGMIEEWRQQ